MRQTICLLEGILLGVILSCLEVSASVRLIPQPAEMYEHNGTFELPDTLSVTCSPNLENEISVLSEVIRKIGRSIHLQSTGQAIINLQLSDTVLPQQTEGYELEISASGIHIAASTSAGIFYGIQTLRQLTELYPNQSLPLLSIRDYPAFAWRGFMLDEARYFKGKDVVCGLLDQMARLKMNVFHWHLTDDQGWRLEIKKYPRLTEIGSHRRTSETGHFGSNHFDGKPQSGFYTQEEVADILHYAKKLHIQVVPEIEMPGHASAAIAAYPWLGTEGKSIEVPGKFGVSYNVYNVADTVVKNALKDILGEVINLFPSPVIHIGGDEVKYNQWKNSPQVQAYMRKHRLGTPAELQVSFTNDLSNWLAANGRRMMGWNEITGMKVHDYQAAEDTRMQADSLAPATIVHFWKGDPAFIRKTVERGYDIVNAYHEYTYLDYGDKIPLEKAYAFNPIPDGLASSLRGKVLGLSCQMWGEFIPTAESMEKLVYPRLAAYAETGWTQPKNKYFHGFCQALHCLPDFP